MISLLLESKKPPKKRTNTIKQKQTHRDQISGYQRGRGLGGGLKWVKGVTVWWRMVSRLVVVITLQCIQLLNDNAVDLKLTLKKRKREPHARIKFQEWSHNGPQHHRDVCISEALENYLTTLQLIIQHSASPIGDEVYVRWENCGRSLRLLWVLQWD